MMVEARDARSVALRRPNLSFDIEHLYYHSELWRMRIVYRVQYMLP